MNILWVELQLWCSLSEFHEDDDGYDEDNDDGEAECEDSV
jgi:hypothetical protein